VNIALEPQPELVGSQWHWKWCSWTASKPHCPTGTLSLAIDYCPYGEAKIEQVDGLWVWVLPELPQEEP